MVTKISRRRFVQGSVIGGVSLATAGAFGIGLTACAPNSNTEEKDDAVKTVYDIIVVGGGIGGMKAALTAAEAGKSVILFDKEGRFGGDATLSDGTIHATGTEIQKERGVNSGDDESYITLRLDPASPYKDVEKSLTKTLYAGARDMVNELSEKGLGFEPIEDWDIWAHNTTGGGYALADFILKEVEASSTELRSEVPVVSLLVEEGTVVGVKVNDAGTEVEYRSPAVILASGGYYNNPELVKAYAPAFDGVLVVGSAGSNGDGLVMAQEIGAADFGLDLGLHTYIVCSKNHVDMSYPMTSSSGIFVNINGERFINEDAHYDTAGKHCILQPEHRGYYIFDEACAQEYDLLNSYFEEGVVEEYDSIEALAEALGMPALIETVAHYNALMDAGADTDFGREWPLAKLIGPKYYAIDSTACVYFSYGGLDIDTHAQVLDPSGNAIPGLYACGEVAAAPEVREGLIYTSGLSAGYVFGKIAAESALAAQEA